MDYTSLVFLKKGNKHNPANPDRQLACTGSEDQVLVDDTMIDNLVYIDIEAWNLQPTKYIAYTTMSITEFASDLTYMASGNGVEFTVDGAVAH